MNVKKKIIFDLCFYISILVIATVIYVSFVLWYKSDKLPAQFMEFMKGFQTGIIFALAVGAIICTIKSVGMLKDEEKLRKYLIRFSDERTKMIQEKSSTLSFRITVSLLFITCIISGFFSIEVFATAYITLMVSCLIKAITAFVLQKKF